MSHPSFRALPVLTADGESSPYCRREGCGHAKNVHRHYRPGEDCAKCECPGYLRPRFWAAWTRRK